MKKCDEISHGNFLNNSAFSGTKRSTVESFMSFTIKTLFQNFKTISDEKNKTSVIM